MAKTSLRSKQLASLSSRFADTHVANVVVVHMRFTKSSASAVFVFVKWPTAVSYQVLLRLLGNTPTINYEIGPIT